MELNENSWRPERCHLDEVGYLLCKQSACLGLTPGTIYSPPSLPGVIPEHRASSKSRLILSVVHKQKKRKKNTPEEQDGEDREEFCLTMKTQISPLSADVRR